MRIIGLIVFAALVGGCGIPMGNSVEGPRPDFPGCDQAQEFAFIGESSLEALGLGQGGGVGRPRVGMVWVTADAVQFGMGAPAPPGMPVQEPSRMVCIRWHDGGGMSAPVEPDWQLPGRSDDAGADARRLIVPLVIGIVLIVVIGASVLAFRSERHPGA